MIPPMDVRCPCCTYRIRIEFENPTVILKVRSVIPGPPDDAPPSLAAEAQASTYPCIFRENAYVAASLESLAGRASREDAAG